MFFHSNKACSYDEYLDKYNKCNPCHSTCKSCNGPSEGHCSRCNGSYILCQQKRGYFCMKNHECFPTTTSTTTITTPLTQSLKTAPPSKIKLTHSDKVTETAVVSDLFGNRDFYFYTVLVIFIISLTIISFLSGRCFRKRYKCYIKRMDISRNGSKRMVEIEDIFVEEANVNEKTKMFNEENKTSSMVSKQKPEQSLVVIGEFSIENFTNDKLDWEKRTLINSGGFGNVYKCPYRDNEGSYYVAVKEAKKHSKEAFKEREFMAQLKDHPHIIKLITTLIDDNMLLVMPLRKSNLSTFLENTKNITITHKIRYCQQIANGMSYLIFKRIVHCDLKASNVLVVDENFVQISDFGISRKMNCGKPKIGTITHTAVELLDPRCGATNCEATDIWSFGVTIWEVFNQTRQSPYADDLGNVTTLALLSYFGSKKHLKTTHWTSANISPVLITIETYMFQCWRRKQEDRPTFNFLWGLFSSKLPECNALPFKLSENSSSNSKSFFK